MNKKKWLLSLASGQSQGARSGFLAKMSNKSITYQFYDAELPETSVDEVKTLSAP
jgi:hypothetical protein